MEGKGGWSSPGGQHQRQDSNKTEEEREVNVPPETVKTVVNNRASRMEVLARGY